MFHGVSIQLVSIKRKEMFCVKIFLFCIIPFKKTSYFLSHMFRKCNKNSNRSCQVIIILLLTNVDPVPPTVGSCLVVPQTVLAEHNPVHSGDKILNVPVAENSKTICLFNSINCREKREGGGMGRSKPVRNKLESVSRQVKSC